MKTDNQMIFDEIFCFNMLEKLYDIYFDLNVNNVDTKYQYIIKKTDANNYKFWLNSQH